MRAALLAAGAALLCTAATAQERCAPAPDPVYSLAYGSRYTDDSANRSDIDAAGAARADEALQPIDDFLRDLTRAANEVLADAADRAARADCLAAQIASWARADAMADLQSRTARLTVGSRIAGFAQVMLQVAPHATRQADLAEITAWLDRLMQAQMLFWEEEAPDGARQGNLRAWAALAGAATAALGNDPVIRGWSAWSLSYVMCKARPDGALPQEMSRGRLALHYQLHAVAPLVTGAALLRRQGIALQDICDGALHRIVGFAVADLEDGARTRQITGEVQSLFDGSNPLEGFALAWLEPYLSLPEIPNRPALEALAETWRPLSYSKLGGDQTLIWRAAP